MMTTHVPSHAGGACSTPMPRGSPPAPVGVGAPVAAVVPVGSPVPVDGPVLSVSVGRAGEDDSVAAGFWVFVAVLASDVPPARSSPNTIASTAAAASSRAPRDHQATDA